MAVIFYFSSRPTQGIIENEPILRFAFFKGLHLLEYSLLAFFLVYALSRIKTTIIVAYLFALSDEIHQTFIFGRSGRFTDTLIDLIGILIGLLLTSAYFHTNIRQSE